MTATRPRGRPAYKPTSTERKRLLEAELMVGQIEAMKSELDDLIDSLVDSPVPIASIAKATGMAPTTLAKRRLMSELREAHG